MANYFLYSDATSTTGKELLAKLKEMGVNITGGSSGPTNKPGVLIRWGSTKPLGKTGNPGKVLNKLSAISLASNKLESLKELKKNGISIPPLFTSVNEITPGDFPVLGRKLHHIGGNDIVLCLQKSDLGVATHAGCSYFTKYIPTSVEYRVHVFGDAVIKTSQKILTEPERNKDPWIRNFDEGYTFHVPQAGFKLSSQTKGMAIDAVAVLGLTFGAVDVLVGDDNKPYLLEVNTAPGLQTDNSIEVYVEKFKAALV